MVAPRYTAGRPRGRGGERRQGSPSAGSAAVVTRRRRSGGPLEHVTRCRATGKLARKVRAGEGVKFASKTTCCRRRGTSSVVPEPRRARARGPRVVYADRDAGTAVRDTKYILLRQELPSRRAARSALASPLFEHKKNPPHSLTHNTRTRSYTKIRLGRRRRRATSGDRARILLAWCCCRPKQSNPSCPILARSPALPQPRRW